MEKKRKVLLIFLITLGFVLRIWKLRELMGFDYDQEVAAFAVDRILRGDLTLIGQEISVGGVFIGPGYYYLLSISYWLFAGDPIGAGYMVALFSILTMILLFIVAKKLFNQRSAFIALLLYSTNAQINFYDRTTAPSNLLMLSSLLSIYLLLFIREGKSKLFPILVFCISVATFHFHPSAIVLFPLIAVIWYSWDIALPNPKDVLLGLLLFLLAVSPLVLFDLRHEFLNIKGAVESLSTAGNQAYFFLFKLLVNLRIQFENLTALFSIGKIGLILSGIFLWLFLKKTIKEKGLIIHWILVPPIIFSFYKRHIPEYYFLPSMPAIIILIALVFDKLLNAKSKIAVYLFLLSIIFLNLQKIYNFRNPYSLKYKQLAVDYLKQRKGKVYVSFDTDLGLESGIRYLLEKENIPLASKENHPTYTIIIPPDRRKSLNNQVIFGGIKVIQSASIQR